MAERVVVDQIITAYGEARNAGYQGTKAEFEKGLKDSAECADNAQESADAAADSAEDSEAYAVGKRGGTDVENDDPAYHNNAKYYKEQAANSASDANTSAGNASNSAHDAEAYAIGKRDGTDVGNDDPAYQNNSKYYSDLASDTVEHAIDNIQDEGDTQVGRVEDKGDEVLNSIPSDYSQLVSDVSDLKEDLAQEDTLQLIKDATDDAVDLLGQIVEQGGDAGSLNGYSLNQGAGKEVILSYTYVDALTEEEVTESVVFVTQTTAEAIRDKLAEIAGIWEEAVSA